MSREQWSGGAEKSQKPTTRANPRLGIYLAVGHKSYLKFLPDRFDKAAIINTRRVAGDSRRTKAYQCLARGGSVPLGKPPRVLGRKQRRQAD